MREWKKQSELADSRQANPKGFTEHQEHSLAAQELRPSSSGINTTIEHQRYQSLAHSKSAGRPHHEGHRERLQQRFLASSGAGMSDYEMLELILFNASPRVAVKPLAKALLAEFGDLNSALVAPASRLGRVRGVTENCLVQFRLAYVVAARMARAKVINRPLISSWPDLMIYCKTVMAHREREQLRLLFLDTKFFLIADEEQAEGTIDHVPVYPREIVKRALEMNAAAIILVHNHPSGDPTPSSADIDMTALIESACATVGIIVHDHIIIGKKADVSFRTLGLL